MNNVIHPFTSVGSLTKKIMLINPDLGVHEIIWLIRQATGTHGVSNAEMVDEGLALELAKATLTQPKGSE